MRLDVGLPTEIVTAGSDSNVSVCIRLGVEAIQRNCYNETNNNNNNKDFDRTPYRLAQGQHLRGARIRATRST